ncbi:MAG: translation initiation factor IF-2 subunit alpha [Candidatus Bathyarchaeota archaeon]|nr:MAG: translation initiation factor IF-2 subunit alpha [Candidatus Bathyarchaeota archaeon]
MTPLKRIEWPERGELVLATVKKVTDYGAYVTLEEYGNKEGLLHRSEISTSWVRNIRNHVREGQKLVLKILRVSPEKKHIDLSRKRVTKRERINKLLTFKHERKAETLLRIAAERLNKSLEEVTEKAAIPMEEAFGDLYTALEETCRQGPEVLTKLDIPQDITLTLAELAKEKIRPPLVEIKGALQLVSTKPEGVNLIKKSLTAAQKTPTPNNTRIHIYTIAAPKYRLKVEAENYKHAESVLQKSAEAAIKAITKTGGKGRFTREK